MKHSLFFAQSWTGRVATYFIVTAFGLASLVPADLFASSAGARRAARVILEKLILDAGIGVRDEYNTGLLRRGDSIVIRTYLNQGNRYYLVAGGCEDAYDVDIAVYDESGNLIDSDSDSSNVAVAEVDPAWSGVFYVKITMYNSTANGAHWILQTGFVNYTS